MTLNQLCAQCQGLMQGEWYEMLPRPYINAAFYWKGTKPLQLQGSSQHSATGSGPVFEYGRMPGPLDERYQQFEPLANALQERGDMPVFLNSLDNVRTNRKAGCHLCRMLWFQISQEYLTRNIDVHKADDRELALVDLLPTTVDRGKGFELHVDLFFSSDLRKILSPMAFFVVEKYTDDLKTPIDPLPSSREKTMLRILHWIKACQQSHTSCNQIGKSLGSLPNAYNLPSRLLEIDGKGSPTDTTVCLRGTMAFSAGVHYATLSHCWGGIPTFCLTSATYGSLSKPMPVQNLPKTFAEAALVANSLGIKYLWIDALCIMQDSVEDWLHEAERMAVIYASGTVNIAATYSQNPSGGLLDQEEDECILNSLVTNIDWSSSLLTEWSGRHRVSIAVDFESLWMKFVEGTTLNSRGWVLQETLLSPRTIHFASDRIRWRCRHSTQCEGFPGTDYWDILGNSFDALDSFIEDDWHRLVSAYTTLGLTKVEDMLPAIGGIARAFQLRHNHQESDYLAGLWKSDLPRQLVWRVTPFGHRLDGEFAPSWSWASTKSMQSGCVEFGLCFPYFEGFNLEKGIQMRSETFPNPLFQLLRSQIHSLGTSLYNRISSGMLYVKALLHPVRLYGYDESNSFTNMWRKADSIHHRARLGARTLDELTSYFVYPENDPALPHWRHFEAYLDDQFEHEQEVIQARWLPLVCGFGHGKRDKKAYSVHGLLIRAVAGRKGLYRRIGTMATYNVEEVENAESEMPLEWDQGAELDEADYLVSHGKGLYEFEII